jgi:hypothetical protein
LLPAGVLAALAAAEDREAAATAEAVARVAAAEAAAGGATPTATEADAQVRRVMKRPRVDTSREDEDPRADPSTEGGRFA